MAEIRQIVRIINADIPGDKQIVNALTSIYGVSHEFSTSVCNALNIDRSRKVGSFSNEEVKKIEETIKDPLGAKMPSYLLNRQRDPDTGKDHHIITSELKLTKEFDVKNFKKIKSYKGIRHALGLPVRGQRTRSNFRKGKSLGVTKKKSKQGKKS